MRFRHSAVVSAAVLAMAVAGPLRAQPAPQERTPRAGPTVGAVLDACQADMKTYCGTEPFPGGLARCMRRNRAQLSPACQAITGELQRSIEARREALRSAMERMRQACETDVKALCGNAGAGRGHLMACMRQNQDKVSQACKTAMGEMRRMTEGRNGARATP